MARPKRGENKEPVISEQEIMERIRQARQVRGQQALALFRQCRERIRFQYGFHLQPFAVIKPGQIILDIELVPIPDWQPPDATPDNGDRQGLPQ